MKSCLPQQSESDDIIPIVAPQSSTPPPYTRMTSSQMQQQQQDQNDIRSRYMPLFDQSDNLQTVHTWTIRKRLRFYPEYIPLAEFATTSKSTQEKRKKQTACTNRKPNNNMLHRHRLIRDMKITYTIQGTAQCPDYMLLTQQVEITDTHVFQSTHIMLDISRLGEREQQGNNIVMAHQVPERSQLLSSSLLDNNNKNIFADVLRRNLARSSRSNRYRRIGNYDKRVMQQQQQQGTDGRRRNYLGVARVAKRRTKMSVTSRSTSRFLLHHSQVPKSTSTVQLTQQQLQPQSSESSEKTEEM